MKTAMQWLKEQYIERGETIPLGVFQEALEKEKEQFDDMFEEGFESAYQHFVNGKDFVQFEQYYNQTYNQP